MKTQQSETRPPTKPAMLGINVPAWLLLAAVCILLLMLVFSGQGSSPVMAQGLTATPISPTPEIAKTAQQLITDANANSANANDIVSNANNSVTTAVLLLHMSLALAGVGVILVGLIYVLTVRSTLSTLGKARADLNVARTQIDDMRSSLMGETEAVRTRAQQASQSLALTQLGEQQISARNIKGALQMYQQAYDLDPTNPASNYFLGELYVQDGQLDRGIEFLHTALQLGSDFAPAEGALAYAIRLQAESLLDVNKRDRHYAHAEERFLRALKMDSAVLDIYGESVHGRLGGLYKRQGRIDKAILHYEAAWKVTPTKSYPVMNLGLLYFTRGEVQRAQDYFQRALTLVNHTLDTNPADYWPLVGRLVANVALAHHDAAMQDVTLIAEQVKTPVALESVLGDLHRIKASPQPISDIDEVIAVVQTAIQQVTNRAPSTAKSLG